MTFLYAHLFLLLGIAYYTFIVRDAYLTNVQPIHYLNKNYFYIIFHYVTNLFVIYYSFFKFQWYHLFADIDIHDISGYTVASRYLKNLQISSAEMTQYMSNLKMAGTNCLTKKYRVPFFNNVLKDKIVGKYMNRSQRCDSLTLTQYTR